jgi:hypothetical protein
VTTLENILIDITAEPIDTSLIESPVDVTVDVEGTDVSVQSSNVTQVDLTADVTDVEITNVEIINIEIDIGASSPPPGCPTILRTLAFDKTIFADTTCITNDLTIQSGVQLQIDATGCLHVL